MITGCRVFGRVPHFSSLLTILASFCLFFAGRLEAQDSNSPRGSTQTGGAAAQGPGGGQSNAAQESGGQTNGGQASGGERLSSEEVSSLPLNERDFSKLLLLASGTMTDTNGAANFTQQFAVNGQRGTATVFAIDGADTTDPELGGATFSNFNVDAIQEVQSSSGVMPAEIGHGAAGFTNCDKIRRRAGAWQRV
jgi:hypothetical protein